MNTAFYQREHTLFPPFFPSLVHASLLTWGSAFFQPESLQKKKTTKMLYHQPLNMLFLFLPVTISNNNNTTTTTRDGKKTRMPSLWPTKKWMRKWSTLISTHTERNVVVILQELDYAKDHRSPSFIFPFIYYHIIHFTGHKFSLPALSAFSLSTGKKNLQRWK